MRSEKLERESQEGGADEAGLRVRALDLFEGDGTAADNWLNTPNPLFGGDSPLACAQTEQGARFVLQVIGRLEHGAFS